jgi:Z1 domain
MSNGTEHTGITMPLHNGNWQPTVGDETSALLTHLGLPQDSQQTLMNETTEILSQCGNTTQTTFSEIGLVFGYIQSGKTMSFTTLTALAKDNGYRMIIIIAGISTNLVAQSFTRLEKDLRIDDRTDMQWLSFKNPKRNELEKRSQIENALKNWSDPTYPAEDKQTILITVMKQKDHLPNLCELLQTVNLSGVPVLIIDDEGDQHSMNTQNRKNARTGQRRMSMIHRRIVELRNAIPHHTFIQYTATPQANLFQDIMNELSPKFIQLLTPGQGYTGGRTFFVERSELTEVIDDINPHQFPDVPPQSLINAMMLFFLGVVKGKPMREGKNRSMMIHPSQLTFTHTEYARFVSSIKNHFIDVLSLTDGNPDKKDLLEQFRVAYNDLKTTTSDLPPFEELTGNRLRHAISSTVIQSLNSTGNNRTIVEWRNSYSWILIGGQAMDRGFTVEGLTVTYMPRSVGVGNADTIQQRARFFGYKMNYIGYCRVYLDGDARDRYIDYVDHEEDMRRRLAEHKNSGRSLDEWYREVFLTSDLSLARASIFSRPFQRSSFGGEWRVIKTPHNTPNIIESNQITLRNFLANNQLIITGRFPTIQKPLIEIYNELLIELRFNSDSDVADYTALLYILETLLEEVPDESCTVFLMSSFEKKRFRSLNKSNQIEQYFQGRNETREGLRDIKGIGITFQIYVLDLEGDAGRFESVVGLATFIPEEIIDIDLIRWA